MQTAPCLLTLLFLYTLTFTTVIQQATTRSLPFAENNDGKQICGRALTQTLQYVCKGVYYSYSKKSSSESSNLDDYTIGYDDESLNSNYPFRQRALRAETFARRASRGIADECCRKPCTEEQMKLYCGR